MKACREALAAEARAYLADAEADILRKRKRSRELRCFWSFPFGHCIHKESDHQHWGTTFYRKCCGCEKEFKWYSATPWGRG